MLAASAGPLCLRQTAIRSDKGNGIASATVSQVQHAENSWKLRSFFRSAMLHLSYSCKCDMLLTTLAGSRKGTRVWQTEADLRKR